MKPLHVIMREGRENKRMTQVEVAKILGIKQSHLSRIERGSLNIQPTMALRMAKLFALTLAQDEVLEATRRTRKERSTLSPTERELLDAVRRRDIDRAYRIVDRLTLTAA